MFVRDFITEHLFPFKASFTVVSVLFSIVSSWFSESCIDVNSLTLNKEALNGNKCSVMNSLTNTYEGTDMPIVYLTLQEEFKGQDYLVMSKSTAQEYLNKCDDDERKEFLSKCTVSYSKEGDCYGITLPRTYVKIAEYQF